MEKDISKALELLGTLRGQLESLAGGNPRAATGSAPIEALREINRRLQLPQISVLVGEAQLLYGQFETRGTVPEAAELELMTGFVEAAEDATRGLAESAMPPFLGPSLQFVARYETAVEDLNIGGGDLSALRSLADMLTVLRRAAVFFNAEEIEASIARGLAVINSGLESQELDASTLEVLRRVGQDVHRMFEDARAEFGAEDETTGSLPQPGAALQS